MIPEEYQKYRPFFEAFHDESDRACAILARALLDDLLRQLFEAHFITGISKKDRKDLLEGQGPLATFSARIRFSNCLGLITSREADDLNLIRSIGNDFAHSINHEIGFENQSVKDRVFTLSFAKGFVEQSQGKLPQDELDEFMSNPRRRYEVAVAILWLFLSERIKKSKPAAEPASPAIGF